jgi:transcriptional regulator with XRE-family HTH domain
MIMQNERLRDALLRKGFTPTALAEKLGVDRKTVERWVTQGRAPYPRHRYEIGVLLGETETYLWPDATSPMRVLEVVQSELVQVYPRRSAVPQELWRRLIDDAHSRIGVLVFAGLFLPEQQPRLVESLDAKGRAGAMISLLLGDPGSSAVALRGAEEAIGEAMAAKIHNVLTYYNRLAKTPGVSLRFHKTTLYNSIYRFDDEMLVNTHAFGFPAAHAPMLHLRRLSGGTLFDFYADSFDRVWSTGIPAWANPLAG